MLLKENEMHNVLVGAVDEITKASHAILKEWGCISMGAAILIFIVLKPKALLREKEHIFFIGNERVNRTCKT